jgi:hypothetical protein
MLYSINTAKEFLIENGRIDGCSENSIKQKIIDIYKPLQYNLSGTVHTLCVSPSNGIRKICDTIFLDKSIVDDVQTNTNTLKNKVYLIGSENREIEYLLTGITISNYDFCREINRHSVYPRRNDVWVSGDNIYVKDIDFSWYNLRIGDLIVFPNAVVLCTGYPHYACWKYAARISESSKKVVNSSFGSKLRLRGVKGAILLKGKNCIKENETVYIVHNQNTIEYNTLLKKCRMPVLDKKKIIYYSKLVEGKNIEATDIHSYINLLITAGKEAAIIDRTEYNRAFSQIIYNQLELQDSKL